MEKTKAKREEMKKEALERLKILGVNTDCINEFSKNDTVYKSKQLNSLDLKSDLENPKEINAEKQIVKLFVANDEEKEIIEKLEKEKGILVYHIIKDYTHSIIDTCFLFVNSNKSEWEQEKEQLNKGEISIYLARLGRINLQEDSCRELVVKYDDCLILDY